MQTLTNDDSSDEKDWNFAANVEEHAERQVARDRTDSPKKRHHANRHGADVCRKNVDDHGPDYKISG